MSRQATVRAVERSDEEPGGQALSSGPARLLDAEEIAAYIGMTTDWVYREVRAGRLPHIRLGRYVRFRRESIDAWLDASERGGTIASARNRPGDAGTSRGRHRSTISHARSS
jgi:excisionase family DNA binding protein